MLWDGDLYVWDILIFRSIALVAAIYFIYRQNDTKIRFWLSILLAVLVTFVIFLDMYLCSTIYSKPFLALMPHEDGQGLHNTTLNTSLSPALPSHEEGQGLNENTLDERLSPGLPSMIYEKPNIMKPPSTEVMLVTPWLAPVVWTGTFNIDILNKQFEIKKYTIGLSVFALGSYWKLVKRFLESADKFFMVGHKVIYYVYTDQPDKVECTTTRTDRRCVLYTTSSYDSKVRIFMKRMEILHLDIKSKRIDVNYLVCADADLVFHNNVSVEILGDLVATLHPDYYKGGRNVFTHERRPTSQAYIPWNEGDFYYQANFFAGTVQEIYHLTKSCDEAIKIDDSKAIIAHFHDESHFNKYLIYHKPTKVLSPEYIWRLDLKQPADIKTIRIIHGQKNI